MKKVLFSIGVILLGNLCFSQWSQVNNGIQDLSYGVLTISGHNGKMYTGTLGGYKLYKSDDYGNNWSEIAPPVAFGLPVSTFSYGNRLFFGLNVVSNDIYYTEDDGATWQVALGGPQSSVVDGFYAFPISSFVTRPIQEFTGPLMEAQIGLKLTTDLRY